MKTELYRKPERSQRVTGWTWNTRILTVLFPKSPIPLLLLEENFGLKYVECFIVITSEFGHNGRVEVHHLCPVSRTQVDGTTSKNSTSINSLDIGPEVMNFNWAPVDCDVITSTLKKFI